MGMNEGGGTMIYQKIFTDEMPYKIGVGRLFEFPEHRHADFEMNFCISGEFDIFIDRKSYHVSEGCTTFVPSMCSHAIPKQENERSVLTLIVGTSFLKKHFNEFTSLIAEPKILDLNEDENLKIKELFLECAETIRSNDGKDELLIMGNIYKVFSLIKKTLSCDVVESAKESDFRKIENIEKALELIYYNYKEEISIDYAASITGYSKSNFCKIFKKIVGESFHKALNRQRASCAAGLLRMSNMSVSAIAVEVGFNETKAFCRVFKDIYGISPGEYRKNLKQ
jgi:AraC-like DNA-binding protein/mannose-6-phosphate isomerase-like protein (cupin superfamily)